MGRIREGWIKLYRSFGENDMTGDPALRSLWIQLLIDAYISHGEARWNGCPVTLEPGQLILTLRFYAKLLNVPRMTLMRKLTYLQKTGRISFESGPDGYKINILKFKEKQSKQKQEWDTNQEKVGREWDTSGTQVGHDRATLIIRKESNKEKDENINIPSASPAGPTEYTPVTNLGKIKKPRNSAKIDPESTVGSFVFFHYAQCYADRFRGEKPIRDKTANSICKSIGESIPRDEIEQLIKTYFSITTPLYVAKSWPLNLLKLDLHSIRTTMLTGIKVTTNQARALERDQNNADVLKRFRDRELERMKNATNGA